MSRWLTSLWRKPPFEGERAAEKNRPLQPTLSAADQQVLERSAGRLASEFQAVRATCRPWMEQEDSTTERCALLSQLGFQAEASWTEVLFQAADAPDEMIQGLEALCGEHREGVLSLLSACDGVLVAQLEVGRTTRQRDWHELLHRSAEETRLGQMSLGYEIGRTLRGFLATMRKAHRSAVDARFANAEASPLVSLHHRFHEQYQLAQSQPLVRETSAEGVPRSLSENERRQFAVTTNLGRLSIFGRSWLLAGAWTASEPPAGLKDVLLRAGLTRNLLATGSDPTGQAGLCIVNALRLMGTFCESAAPRAPIVAAVRSMLESVSSKLRQPVEEFPEMILIMLLTLLRYPSPEGWSLARKLDQVSRSDRERLLDLPTVAAMARASCQNTDDFSLVGVQVKTLARAGFPVDALEAAWRYTFPGTPYPQRVSEVLDRYRARPKIVVSAPRIDACDTDVPRS